MGDSIAELMTGLLDAWNSHDLERVASFYAPDFDGEDVGQARHQRGPRERALMLGVYVRAFPDVHFTGESLIEGNRAALIWTMRGTHRGTFMGIPPTGRTVEVRGTSLVTFEDGKVKRGLNIWDTAGLLRALGMLPDL
jgi:steroid delta-isomerase-like uncharacterized protein